MSSGSGCGGCAPRPLRAANLLCPASPLQPRAIRDFFGPLGIIQRCQVRKHRNVFEHLPEAARPRVRRVLTETWAMSNVKLAEKRLRTSSRIAPTSASRGGDGAARSRCRLRCERLPTAADPRMFQRFLRHREGSGWRGLRYPRSRQHAGSVAAKRGAWRSLLSTGKSSTASLSGRPARMRFADPGVSL